MTNGVYRALFWTMVYAGRPIGGIRPRRITYWLQRKAFPREAFSSAGAKWRKDRWGTELLVNPYYLLDASVIAFGAFEPDLHQYLERHVRSGMICFDVGANIGVVSVHLGRLVGQSGRVHAFEPVPAILERLDQHVERNGMTQVVNVHPIALSNQTGTASFAVADSDASNQAQGSLVTRNNPSLTRLLDVTTVTLDEFVEQQKVDRIDLMKIDIQGSEIFLLEGGKRTFSELGPDLLMEVSPEDLVNIGKSSQDLLEMVESYGYFVFELAHGTPSKRVTSASVPPDYYNPHVLCTKRRVEV
ncbi:FkbM family methyltransferase [Actinopolymorpha sp. B11F2]|uniref:FkbM family methyltransferase n=1 Tax=Actinopolymorpha sp. B11F2 TaxID=3160862 RepID=UPI0032E46580